jgi:hypothetical protein
MPACPQIQPPDFNAEAHKELAIAYQAALHLAAVLIWTRR